MLCWGQVEWGGALGVDTGLEFGGAEAVGGEPAGAWAGRGSERVAGPTGPRAWWGRKPCGDRSRWGHEPGGDRCLASVLSEGQGGSRGHDSGQGSRPPLLQGCAGGLGRVPGGGVRGGARSGRVSVCWPPWT